MFDSICGTVRDHRKLHRSSTERVEDKPESEWGVYRVTYKALGFNLILYWGIYGVLENGRHSNLFRNDKGFTAEEILRRRRKESVSVGERGDRECQVLGNSYIGHDTIRRRIIGKFLDKEGLRYGSISGKGDYLILF